MTTTDDRVWVQLWMRVDEGRHGEVVQVTLARADQLVAAGAAERLDTVEWSPPPTDPENAPQDAAGDADSVDPSGGDLSDPFALTEAVIVDEDPDGDCTDDSTGLFGGAPLFSDDD